MIRALLYKWFGLTDPPCETCEVLRTQLERSDRERSELLHKLLQRDEIKPEPLIEKEELKPILPQHIPWRVRQQMLEAEDRKKAELMKNKEREIEIAELEKELEIK